VINEERVPRDVVTIGASAGGVEMLIRLFRSLPRDLPAIVAVVIHRSPIFETRLPLVLGRRARLPVVEPEEGEALVPGCIYVAPRDQHMLITPGRIRLTRGPKEHSTRPAIDPLFRSGAEAYGPRTTGVLLTGFGADGVRGLIAIKAAGGISLVQDPEEAPRPALPRSAIANDDVDAILTIDEMAQAIVDLSAGKTLTRSRNDATRAAPDEP
jgi:two-component system chemotaxis response regulator CheB